MPGNRNLPAIPGISLMREIGRGGQGIIYLGIRDGNDYAVKTESVDVASPTVKKEYEILKYLGRYTDKIPKVFEYGETEELRFFVMELFTTSLDSLVEDVGHFSVPNLARIHRADVVLRDVKIANILIQLPSNRMAFSDPGFAIHRKDEEADHCVGTYLFAPPAAHEGKSQFIVQLNFVLPAFNTFSSPTSEQGPSSDYISLFYSAIFMHCLDLPWSHFVNENKHTPNKSFHENLLAQKSKQNIPNFCGNFPEPFEDALLYLYDLCADEDVDVDYIMNCLYWSLDDLGEDDSVEESSAGDELVFPLKDPSEAAKTFRPIEVNLNKEMTIGDQELSQKTPTTAFSNPIFPNPVQWMQSPYVPVDLRAKYLPPGLNTHNFVDSCGSGHPPGLVPLSYHQAAVKAASPSYPPGLYSFPAIAEPVAKRLADFNSVTTNRASFPPGLNIHGDHSSYPTSDFSDIVNSSTHVAARDIPTRPASPLAGHLEDLATHETISQAYYSCLCCFIVISQLATMTCPDARECDDELCHYISRVYKGSLVHPLVKIKKESSLKRLLKKLKAGARAMRKKFKTLKKKIIQSLMS
ncbi:kinase-like domain-containing protein [Paraphysoderma sedebokerense]|nr:kinase-like domain-containing protein [Paraphysoderma sedebokerense]